MTTTPKNSDPAQPKPRLSPGRPAAASTARSGKAPSAKPIRLHDTKTTIVGKVESSRNSNRSKRKTKLEAEDYTVEQIADLLNCSTKTVRRRIEAGALRADRDGGMVRISTAEYLRYRATRDPVI